MVSHPVPHPGPNAIELTFVDTVPGSNEAGSIAHFDVHADGSVAFLDGMTSEVTVVPSGGHAFKMGGAGEGPGEISRGGGVAFLSDGSIVVQDIGLRRLTAWHADGSLRTTIRFGMPTSALRASGDELLVRFDPGPIQRSSPGPVAGLRVAFVRYSDLEPVDTVRPPMYLPGADRGDPYGGALTCLFCPFLSIGDSLILVKIPSPEYDLALLDREGAFVRRIVRPDVVRPRHSQATWERMDDRRRRSAAGMFASVGLDLSFPPARPPPDPLPRMPAFRDPLPFGADGEGRLWVLLSSPSPDRSFLDVHDLERETFQQVEVDGVSLLAIQVAGDWVVGSIRGPLDEPALVRLRIQRIHPPQTPGG